MKRLLIVIALVTANASMTAPAFAIAHMEHASHSKPVAYKPGKLVPIHIKKGDIDFRRSRDGFAYINDQLCAVDEDNQYATVYSQGLMQVIVYKQNSRINALQDGKDLTRLR